MKVRNIISIGFIIGTILSSAAQKIGFAYDAVGNRIKREIVVSRDLKKNNRTAENDTSFYDTLEDKTIRITRTSSNTIVVSILNFDSKDSGFVDLCSINGMRVYLQNLPASEINIDMGSLPSGLYILRVQINDNSTTWKISNN